MIRLQCPICNNDSYTKSVEEFRTCPYCGTLFSGKYGIDRRSEKRWRREVPVELYLEGKKINASSRDLTKAGMNLRIAGMYQFSVGKEITLKIKDSYKRARILWIKDLSDSKEISIGLKIEEGIDLTNF